jgi:hypothetical protein
MLRNSHLPRSSAPTTARAPGSFSGSMSAVVPAERAMAAARLSGCMPAVATRATRAEQVAAALSRAPHPDAVLRDAQRELR